MRRRPIAAMIGVIIVTIITVATGCSLGTPHHGGSAQVDRAGSDANDADVRFAVSMIPHHWRSIEVAELVEGHSGNEFLTALAAEIRHGEAGEIELMSGWLRSWGVEVSSPADHAGHDQPGMIGRAELAQLRAVSGPAFDRTLRPMLARHLGLGVEMAEAVLASGTHAGTNDLAQRIVTSQRATIAELTAKAG